MKPIKLLGGPLHGKHFMVPSDIHDEVRVPVAPEPVVRKIGPPDDADKPVDVTVIHYRRREILGSEVWVPDVMRDAQIIELLVQHYERS